MTVSPWFIVYRKIRQISLNQILSLFICRVKKCTLYHFLGSGFHIPKSSVFFLGEKLTVYNLEFNIVQEIDKGGEIVAVKIALKDSTEYLPATINGNFLFPAIKMARKKKKEKKKCQLPVSGALYYWLTYPSRNGPAEEKCCIVIVIMPIRGLLEEEKKTCYIFGNSWSFSINKRRIETGNCRFLIFFTSSSKA
ncbi:hypothetical protein BDF21DRAFT_450145 [Thamnidium elegans]|nr:hypothetical protein BDF21DRAFT_450145 [Thamnidium elegans]